MLFLLYTCTMNQNKLSFAASELICNPDGSIYHLALLPEQLAKTIILVGDPDRVPLITKHFDSIFFKTQHREFVTHTGILQGKKISVVSTGIGTDNIDIVLNELDLLANYDFVHKQPKTQHQTLQMIRIGTCGALQTGIEPDAFVVSKAAIGLDGLMHFYHTEPNSQMQALIAATHQALPEIASKMKAYAFEGSSKLAQYFQTNFIHGITVTCAGFYAPQGRRLGYKPTITDLPERLMNMDTPIGKLANFEMETAGIYGLAHVLGHEALSISQVLANRANGSFTQNPKMVMETLIANVLETVVRLPND